MARAAKPPVGPTSTELAAIIRGRLAHRQLKHADLAAALDVHRNHLSRMLNAHSHIDVDQLATIARFLGERASALLAEAEDETLVLGEAATLAAMDAARAEEATRDGQARRTSRAQER